jgi:hypothetical protein
VKKRCKKVKKVKNRFQKGLKLFLSPRDEKNVLRGDLWRLESLSGVLGGGHFASAVRRLVKKCHASTFGTFPPTKPHFFPKVFPPGETVFLSFCDEF